MMGRRTMPAAFPAVFAMATALSVAAPALDWTVRVIPQATVPLNDSDTALFTTGGGLSAAAEAELFRGLSPLAEAGISALPLNGTGEAMTLASFGLGASYFYYPIPRLKLRAAGTFGLYNASALELGRRGVYWNARLEGGYRFSPTFSLLAGLGYADYLNEPTPGASLFKGISIALTADLGIGSASARSSGVTVSISQAEPVFPIRYYAYAEEPLGTVTISNDEASDIRDVEVLFECEGFTSAAVLCGSIPLIRRRGSVDIPLRAAFGERVLEFTENAKAQGRVLVRYRLLDTRIERSYSTAVAFHHRNAATWKDPRWAAAFASPNDAAVLDLSKFVAGLVRELIRPDLDHALQYGMGLFEGLRLAGLSYSADPSAPYAQYRGDAAKIDYIQYPYQTFAYKGGDSDDLSLLYIVALASVGLETAFVPLPDKAYAAFALDTPELEARRFFTDPSMFVWRDGKVWVVVDTSRLREGFIPAWHAGAEAWNRAAAAGNGGDFYPMTAAWQAVRPVGVSAAESRIPKPREDRLELAFENAMSRFVAMELGPKVERIRAELGPSGGTARQLNSLGILYARYGLLREAKDLFAQAVAKGSRPAVINRANIAFLLREYDEAARYYGEVLAEDPRNRAALLGLARARYELDAYAEADDLFARLNNMDPAYAAKYAYLSSRVGGASSRASAASTRDVSVPWQDED